VRWQKIREVAGKNMASGRKINCYSVIREETRKYEKYKKKYGQLNMGNGREIKM